MTGMHRLRLQSVILVVFVLLISGLSPHILCEVLPVTSGQRSVPLKRKCLSSVTTISSANGMKERDAIHATTEIHSSRRVAISNAPPPAIAPSTAISTTATSTTSARLRDPQNAPITSPAYGTATSLPFTCPSSPLELCDFYFAGSPSSLPFLSDLSALPKDAPVSPAVVYLAANQSGADVEIPIEVDRSGMAAFLCSADGRVTAGDQFYLTGGVARLQIRNFQKASDDAADECSAGSSLPCPESLTTAVLGAFDRGFQLATPLTVSLARIGGH